MPIAVGQVYRLMCQTCTKPKVKYFVIALTAPCVCFVINSTPTAFQLGQPVQMAALAPVLRAENRFLHHDSYVACNQLFAEYDEQAILNAVAADPNVYLGQLGPNAYAAVVAALTGNRLIPRGRLALITAAW